MFKAAKELLKIYVGRILILYNIAEGINFYNTKTN